MASRLKLPRWLLIVAVVIFCVALLVLILVPALRKSDPGRSYVVMVDAGSSSSKLYVYSWPSEASKDETPADIKQEFFQRTKEAGISFYADKPQNASKEIVDILKEKVLGDVEDGPPAIIPAKQRAITPILMGATAGMRLLVARDPVRAERLLNNIRNDFSKLGLLVENATKQMRVITGDEEALAGWISSNYLSDTLRPSPNTDSKPQEGTIGALDMGGASTQVSFVTTAPVGIEVIEISLYGRKFRVYQHSFLCFGKGEARNQIYATLWVKAGRPLTAKTIDNPCAQRGFSFSREASTFLQKPCFNNTSGQKLPSMTEKFTFRGSGDYNACRQLTSQLFEGKKCPYDRCSFDGIFQPPIPPGNFVAFSSYYFAMSFYNVTRDNATRAQLQQRLKDFCQRPWESVRKQYTPKFPATFISGYCFDGIYIDETLRKLGFDDNRWSDVAFTGKIGKRKMSWPLGFILKESGGVPAGLVSYSIPQPTYVGVIVLFVILLLLAIVLLLIFAHSYWWSHKYSPANTEPSQKV